MGLNLNLKDRDLRQRDLVPPGKLAICAALVVGVGAVGRQVALQLTAMGIMNLTLVDFDTVDVVNLAPQGYSPKDLGSPKVQATAESCRRLNPDLLVFPICERFRRSSPKTLACFGGPPDLLAKHLVAFSCVDSIIARGIVWEAVKDRADFFGDARMSAEVIRVLASDRPAREEHYPTTLFAQDQAYAGNCTAKSTIYTASIAAGLMLSQFTKWLRGLPLDKDLLLNLLAGELTAA
jgi:sulfur carrier protein ThiS adenylyltransferase